MVWRTPRAAEEITIIQGVSAGSDGDMKGDILCVTGEVTLMERKDARLIRKPNTPCIPSLAGVKR